MVGTGLAHSVNGKKDSGAGFGGVGGGGWGVVVACRALRGKFGAVAITGGSGVYPRWGNSIS